MRVNRVGIEYLHHTHEKRVTIQSLFRVVDCQCSRFRRAWALGHACSIAAARRAK